MDLKTITATLAVLGTTTAFAAGCGGENKDAKEVQPAAASKAKAPAAAADSNKAKPADKAPAAAAAGTPAAGSAKPTDATPAAAGEGAVKKAEAACGAGKCGAGKCGGNAGEAKSADEKPKS